MSYENCQQNRFLVFGLVNERIFQKLFVNNRLKINLINLI